ncbi:hypothetical protein B0H19DRAFT_1316674 [Mycena capillaripes]|nr:hypothetical protein B0H19DRAFT_1316674 [Mycena capillaripes]
MPCLKNGPPSLRQSFSPECVCDEWRTHRRLLNRVFNSKAVRKYDPAELAGTQAFLARLLHVPEDFMDQWPLYHLEDSNACCVLRGPDKTRTLGVLPGGSGAEVEHGQQAETTRRA